MRAIILAAGRGSRLHPFTEDCPKCLTELGGQTLIENQITTLRGAGIDDIVIVTGYLSEMLALPGIRQVRNDLWATTNMVESLFCAKQLFGDDLIISYGDIIYEPAMIEALMASNEDISVVIDTGWQAYWEHRFEDPLSDAETLRLDDAGRILEIGNKPKSLDQIEAQYTGLMRFRGPGVTALADAYASLRQQHRPWMEVRPLEQAYMTDLLMEMILTGQDVYGIPVNRGWYEIDTPHDLDVARACL